MGADSKIEWTHHTFNPWRGCTKVSQGCKHCYAETMSGRNPAVLGIWGPKGTRVVAAESYWRQPIKWDAAAKAAGERRRVFCASLADVFEGPETMPAEAWPGVLEARRRLFHLIDETEYLDWLLLTKRPQHVMRYAPSLWCQQGFPSNIWIGTSVEDQAAADERIPHLLKVPARVRFLSCEPLLGPVDLTLISDALYDAGMPFVWNKLRQDERGIKWVIVGGESGAQARPMHPEWSRSLRDQCQAAGVAFHFKQHGEWAPLASADEASHYPRAAMLEGDDVRWVKIGKRAAGRLLDGRTWDEVPS